MSEGLFEDLSFFSEILKKSGYKSLAFGMAEIVDNAIDAGANDMIILAESEKPNSNLLRLGFMDNGKGMEPETLVKSLKVGGRVIDQFKGRTGKFGFGLPGSSIANSDIVHVYSWTESNPGKVFKVTLDANHLNEGITDPEETILPTPYSDFVGVNDLVIGSGDEKLGPFDYTKSGTLVLWDGCQRVSPKRPKNIFNKQVKKTLGRLFRHFLTEDEDYKDLFHSLNIYWVHDLISGSKPTLHKVKPNDPLYLMNDNQLSEERYPVMFDHTNSISIDVDGSKIDVIYSLACKELRNSYKGKSFINDEIGANQGISIVREGREIDFGNFDFIDTDVRHRWHGCEIHFDSGLDDLFGVPANKQHVDRLRKYESEEGEFSEDTPLNELPIHILLQNEFRVSETLNDYLKTIRGYAKQDPDTLPPDEGDVVIPGEDVDVVDDDTTDDADSSSGGKLDTSDEEAVRNCRDELIRLGYENPTEHQINRFLSHKVVWEVLPLGESAGFVDVRVKHGYCILTLNQDSYFYQNVLTELYETDQDNDTDLSRGIELILLAYARCMDLGRNLEGGQGREFRRVLTRWSQKSEEFLDSYYGE
jgi:hypothetical protein